MKYIFLLLSILSFSVINAQTATTKAKLRTTTTASSSTVYRVIEGIDTSLYKAYSNIANIDDGNNVLVSTSGIHFVKLVPAINTTVITPVVTIFSSAQYNEVNRLIDSATKVNTFYIDSRFFDGGTKLNPFKPKQ